MSEWMSEDEEKLCRERAMQQWRASLKRSDLTDEDRVLGAIFAYERQAFAIRILRPPAQSHQTREGVER